MKFVATVVFLILSVYGAAHAQEEQRTPITNAPAVCTWESVGLKYNINPALLYAIAKTESSLRPNAINRNTNGSYDIGMMQINSSWLPRLAKHGITEKHLYDPCISLDVGAWVLYNNMQRLGNSWTAVGAYNAASPDKRIKYASTVYKNIPFHYKQ